jgi:sporulation protein YlmC with PRC-barrel domain
VARLLGLDVFDPLGDRLGRLRDVVVLSRGTRGAPHVVGIVVEVPGKKRVFVPMTRITSIDQTQISAPDWSTCAASNSAAPRPSWSPRCSTGA